MYKKILKSFAMFLGIFLGSFLLAHATMKYLTPAGDSEGYSFGTASTDKISFYGATPVVKTSIAATRLFDTFSTTSALSTYTVDTSITGNKGMYSQQFAVSGIISGYPVSVFKPTYQAGIGFAGAHGTSNGAVTINFIGGNLQSTTSTAGETYRFTQIVPGTTGAAGLGSTLGLW